MKRTVLSTLLLAALLVGVAGTALAARSPKDEKLRIVPADQARARSLNLRRADFPTGWIGENAASGSAPEGNVRCAGTYDPDLSKVTISGWADSPTFSRGTQVVASSVHVYATKAQLAREWTLGESPAAVRCFGLDLKKTLAQPGVKLGTVSVTRLPLSLVAPRQASWRYRVRGTASGATLDAFADLISLARGRAYLVIFIIHTSVDSISEAFEARLASLTGQRLARTFP